MIITCKDIKRTLDYLHQKIKEMQCCGNCDFFETVCGEGKCFAYVKHPASRYDKDVKYADGSGVCARWEEKR